MAAGPPPTQAYVFPREANEPQESVRPTGEAAAAAAAAGIGVLAMGGSALVAAAIGRFDQALVDAGRLFLPGGEELGRFGGQQVLGLVAWLASWAILHLRWRKRNVSLTVTALGLVACLVVATILFWPPVTRWLIPLSR